MLHFKGRRQLAGGRRADRRRGRLSRLPALSDVLVEFAQPLLEHIARPTYAEGKSAIAVAVLSWNASFLPARERASYIDDFISALGIPKRVLGFDVRRTLRSMVTRKLDSFAGDPRFVVDYQLSEHPRGLHLQVDAAPYTP
jgi:hypothetical protein